MLVPQDFNCCLGVCCCSGVARGCWRNLLVLEHFAGKGKNNLYMSSSDVEMDVPEPHGLLTPGELITDDPSWMRGHGTYGGSHHRTFASVAGQVQRTNRLLTVRALRGRYNAIIGDHVVGRITEVGNRRWKVDIGSTQDAVLQLGSVNLPGGILRRKSDDDELQMREFLKEGDLLNCEIQSLFFDGGAALHTRSLRYGKLRNGVLVQVPSSLILRQSTQSHQLEGNVEVIIGVNGYIWLRMASSNSSGTNAPATTNPGLTRLEQDTDAMQIYKDTNDYIPLTVRQTISRYANCVRMLVDKEMQIYGSRLRELYEASLTYGDAGQLLEPAVKDELCSRLTHE